MFNKDSAIAAEVQLSSAEQARSLCCVGCVDFTSAFDAVSHDKLLRCLYSYGIRGDLLRWTMNFFTSRTQQAKVGMALSELINLLSGVIQGSSIGPVMFLMYIDGLAKHLEHY